MQKTSCISAIIVSHQDVIVTKDKSKVNTDMASNIHTVIGYAVKGLADLIATAGEREIEIHIVPEKKGEEIVYSSRVTVHSTDGDPDMFPIAEAQAYQLATAIRTALKNTKKVIGG